MSIHEHSDAIKKHIIKQVEEWALKEGIEFPKGSLSKNVILSREDIETIISSKPVKPSKPKRKKKVRFNNTSKPKFNIKSNFELFVDICNKHNLVYFEYYDEHNWSGPALKVNDYVYDITASYFDSIELKCIHGTDFYIIHPKKQCKNNIKYPEEPIESCKLESESLIISTSDAEADADAEDIYNQTTASESEEELELEEWTHESKGIKYLLDVNTNNLYNIKTTDLIGKKLDEFNIEFI